MRSSQNRAITLIAVAGAMISTSIFAESPKPVQISPVGTVQPAVFFPKPVSASSGVAELKSSTIHRFGGVAGIPPGTTVYLNEFIPPPGSQLEIWQPGVNDRLADDLELPSGATDVVYYSLAVAGTGTSGPTFSAETALWTGDPCKLGSTIIAGTEAVIADIPNDGTAQELGIAMETPVAVPAIVWLAVTFSSSDAGWILGEKAELGYTRDLFSEDDTNLGFGCATLFFTGGSPYSGFWTTINANPRSTPRGACCDGVTCSETAQAACTAGSWLGAYSTCDPDPCALGTCCSGGQFDGCVDGTEADCVKLDGMFSPGDLCPVPPETATPCKDQFLLYQNDQENRGVLFNATGTKLADDQTMAAGAPCDLSAYVLDTFGQAFSGSYDVTVELWGMDPVEGFPTEAIPGTRTVFVGVRDGANQRLIAGPFTGVTLPPQVWMVMSTSTATSGWMIGGQALLGETADVFAIYNHPAVPNAWGAFNITDDPTQPPIWDGFRANVLCNGTMPIGACCSDSAGTCIDGLSQLQCEGRWAPGATCASNPFIPGCGVSACCQEFGCSDLSIEACESVRGAPAPGQLCNDSGFTCPRTVCLTSTGDCFSDNGQDAPGCSDAFCCEAVCQGDSLCCTNTWDNVCAEDATANCQPAVDNDNCSGAEAFTGEGTVAFDNTGANTDGPPHATCAVVGGDEQIKHDVWICYTAPCTDTIYVRTCGLTDIDSKIAVYEGCDVCPPTEASLLQCNDDACGFDPGGGGGFQSQVAFGATAGNEYLVRVGTFPGGGTFPEADGGPGEVDFACGLPVHATCTAGAGDCCEDTNTPGCDDDSCCRRVCACDPFCCETEWDIDCSTEGFGGNGCGAGILCSDVCGEACPDIPVTFENPLDGTVDARQPHPPADSRSPQGISELIVRAGTGVANVDCWSLCETAVQGTANAVTELVDNRDGTFTVRLARAITTGAVTKVTFTAVSGATYSGTITSHPGNTDGDSASGPPDILKVIDYLNGVSTSPWGLYSEDVDHSDSLQPPDILRVIDLLNGAGSFDPWLNVPKPDCGACCSP